jgi:hypothetical protein
MDQGATATGKPAPVRAPHTWRWRGLAALLILGATLGRCAYLLSACPFDLAPDEAHYWDWSRHLDWSYYSKGPLVAWLIGASDRLLGETVSRWSGTATAAVRLPAVLCGGLLLLALYCLTVQVWRRESLACGVVALALTLPVVGAGALLMTIDAPYTCCWAWALVLGHAALFGGRRWAWPAAGLLVGLGFLAKYTMVLWLLSLALFLLTTPRQWHWLRRPGPWLLLGVAALLSLPVLCWNAAHDWVSVRHISGLAGLKATGWRWWGPLVFVGTQAALLLGVWFLLWLQAMGAQAPWRTAADERRYLWWMSAVTFLVFAGFALKTGGGEPNWPVTAYLSGLVLAAGWLWEQGGLSGRRGRWVWGTVLAGSVLGLLLQACLYRADLVRPLLALGVGPPRPAQPLPLRRLDPTCRLVGWRALAAAVEQQRQRLRQQGEEPLLAAENWSLPGELAFYSAGRPTVYCLGAALGDRHSQYDLWRPNPIADPELFQGRTFIFVGTPTPILIQAFQQVETPHIVTYSEKGQPLASWTVCICRGFRGFCLLPAEAQRDY